MGVRHAGYLLRPKRLSPMALVSRQILRNLYTSTQSPKLHDPSPSELLRFAVTDSTKSMKDLNSDVALSEHLRDLFSVEWKLKSPPTSLWPALKGLAPDNEELLRGLTQVTDLSSLQSLVERYVKNERGAELLQTQNCTLLRLALQRCARQTALPNILSTISDIMARLNYLQLPIQSSVFTTGISFAMLDLSAPTLERFLGAHRLIGLPALGQRAYASYRIALMRLSTKLLRILTTIQVPCLLQSLGKQICVQIIQDCMTAYIGPNPAIRAGYDGTPN